MIKHQFSCPDDMFVCDTSEELEMALEILSKKGFVVRKRGARKNILMTSTMEPSSVLKNILREEGLEVK